MGKSKRIRAERAHAIAANPEKHVAKKDAKKTPIVTIVIIAVIAAMVLGCVALAITQSTGLVLRMQNAYTSANYAISGTMMAYLYQTQFNYMYNLYYQYLGSSVSSYLSSIQASSQTSAKTQAEQILKLCEAAKAANVVLEAEDFDEINETIKNIEDSVKKLGTSVSAYYGNQGVTIDDIRAMLELSTLASKYDEIKTEEFKNSVKDNDEALLEFINKHKSQFYKADYLTYTADDKAVAEAFANLKTSDEFLSELIKMTVNGKYETEFKTAASKLEAADKPVKALEDAIKLTMIEELKYSLLEIEIEGLDLTEKTLRKDRLKAIFDKLNADNTFAAGKDDDDKATAVTISDALYGVLATAGDAISKTASTTVNNAKKLEQAYALPDPKDEEEKEEDDKAAEEDEPTESELWIFSDERKDGDSTVITNKPEKETDKETYTVIVLLKANYLDEEMTKDVGHILLKVETETASSSATDEEKKQIEEKNDKAFADKKPSAEKLLSLVAGKTKDQFEAVAKENNEDSNIFYEGVHTGEMVEEFEDWLFDETRKVGDTGLVKTKYGWHVMYFVGDGGLAWRNDAISAYADDAWQKWYDGLTYEVTANDSTIKNACS